MTDKTLSTSPSIDPTATVTQSSLGAYTEVGARTKLLEVALGGYSYIVNDSDIAYASIGKFTSIAAMTRINPGNHPMRRASQAHFSFRASAYFDGASDEAEFFAWRRGHHVSVGHDVWIGHWPHEMLHAAMTDFRVLTAEQFLDKYEQQAAVPALTSAGRP